MNGEVLMRKVTAAFEKSDLQPLLDALHQDVVWISASRHASSPFSFKGDHKNRGEILEVLSNISKDYTFHRLEPVEINECGNVVWGLFRASLRYEPKGKNIDSQVIETDWVLRWKIEDGKIIEHRAFFDTAYLLQKQGGLQP